MSAGTAGARYEVGASSSDLYGHRGSLPAHRDTDLLRRRVAGSAADTPAEWCGNEPQGTGKLAGERPLGGSALRTRTGRDLVAGGRSRRLTPARRAGASRP